MGITAVSVPDPEALTNAPVPPVTTHCKVALMLPLTATTSLTALPVKQPVPLTDKKIEPEFVVIVRVPVRGAQKRGGTGGPWRKVWAVTVIAPSPVA